MNIQKARVVFVLCTLLLASLMVLSACASGAGTSSHSSTSTNGTSSANSGPAGGAGQSSGAESLWDIGINTVSLESERISSDSFAGNDLTVLNVWATSCPGCIHELPYLQEVSERFAGKNVQIVGVLGDGLTSAGVPDETAIATAQTLLANAGATYLVVLPDETLWTQLLAKTQYYPTTYFIDSNGKLVHTVAGVKDANTWEEEINEVLNSIS